MDHSEDNKNAPPVLNDDHSIASTELPYKDAQDGVQAVEAITTVWGTNSLILAYVLYAVLYFTHALLTAAEFSLSCSSTLYNNRLAVS
jgi:hypothetical protein